MIKLTNLTLSIDQSEEDLFLKSALKAKLQPSQIKYFKILKKSVDARRGKEIKFVYSVELDTKPKITIKPVYNQIKTDKKIVIIGLGPAGLFCGLTLARMGLKPLIFERGESVDNRAIAIDSFIKSGILNTCSNVQFGEGGAGTFSDGKLNTQVNSDEINNILNELVGFGAPEEIAYLSKPHIGSDNLKKVVKNIRNEIIKLGGEVRFNSLVTNVEIVNGKVKAVIVGGEKYPCDYLVLAIGHSARDTFKMLFEKGVFMEQKEFAVGFRCEQKQSLIDSWQYGKYAGHKNLKPSDYKLVYHGENRSAFTFCMCPGGVVMPATSEENMVVTNGMSNYLRNEENANSALICQVKKADFPSSHPLGGVEFQRMLERKAFEMGGGDYKAPCQLATDFVRGVCSTQLKNVNPTYARGVNLANLVELFPDPITKTLQQAVANLDEKINGFGSKGAVICGVESRTSSPVRILRGKNYQSINVEGLFPCGEGCGYAGGIMSASIDGVKVARAIIEFING